MAVTVTVTTVDTTQQGIMVEGTLALTGSYVSGGDTVNFLTVPQIVANTGPRGLVMVLETTAAGGTPTGYSFWFLPGTTLANGVLWIGTPGVPATQFSAGAYSAGLLAATISFRAYFPFGV